MSASAAVAGAYLGHKFGRDAETDGFLAAYGVYLVLALAAQAFRLVIVPDLTRAEAEDRLTAELVSYASAFLVVGIPATALTWIFSEQFGEALTGSLPHESATIAARALVWLVPAAFGQLLGALAASALAARDSYVVAAFGYVVGAVVGLVVFVSLAGEHGLIALAWGIALNTAFIFGVPLAALIRYGYLTGSRRGGIAILPRLARLVQAAAVPLALQGIYLIALRAASGLGEGNQTSLTYGYLFASTLVAATASSLSVISSAPLTRRGIDVESAAAHVEHATWISLTLIGAAAGVFALVGGRVMSIVLGSAFKGEVGRQLGHLIVYLSPWMVTAVAFAVTFPLLFVLEKPRVLIPLALAAVAVHVPVTLALRSALGLRGLAVAMGITTFAVIVVLMAAVSRRMVELSVVALVRTSLLVAALVVAAFGIPSVFLGSIASAVIGVVVYFAALIALRPRGLVDAWHYVRALHH